MTNHHDVIVIGAGPAGLAASACLAEMGLDVLTLDEQNRIGGQIYRNIEAMPKDRLKILGEDYAYGLEIAGRKGGGVQNSWNGKRGNASRVRHEYHRGRRPA